MSVYLGLSRSHAQPPGGFPLGLAEQSHSLHTVVFCSVAQKCFYFWFYAVHDTFTSTVRTFSYRYSLLMPSMIHALHPFETFGYKCFLLMPYGIPSDSSTAQPEQS